METEEKVFEKAYKNYLETLRKIFFTSIDRSSANVEPPSATSSSGWSGRRKPITMHLVIPASTTVVFFIIASLPVDLLGCRMRGLLAASVAIAGGILAIVASLRGLIGRIRGEKNSYLWMAGAVIFAIPAAFIVLTAS